MGVYKEKAFGFDFGFEKQKGIVFKVLLALVLLIFLVAFLYALNSLVAQKPIDLWLEKNPITPTEEVILHAKITNTTNFNANNVVVTAKPRGENVPLLLSIEKNGVIESIAAGDNREIQIMINPLENEILEGEYTIDVTAKINEEEFTKEIKIKIEK